MFDYFLKENSDLAFEPILTYFGLTFKIESALRGGEW
jgi:hypothetical protein